MCRRIHTKHDKPDAHIIISQHEDHVAIVAKVHDKFINFANLLQYNVYINETDIGAIEKSLANIDVPKDLVMVDKVIAIYLHNTKLLVHYMNLANYVIDNIDDIRDQLRRKRNDVNDRYRELCASGFKYTIAKIVQSKELIGLYHS
jgi:hypothetical protein